MLRRGDETMSIVEIGPESPLNGVSVGTLEATIIAIRSPDGDVDTIPKRDRLIQSGDHLFAIGRPELLRKLESTKDTQLIGSDGAPSTTATGVTDVDGTDPARRDGPGSEDADQ